MLNKESFHGAKKHLKNGGRTATLAATVGFFAIVPGTTTHSSQEKSSNYACGVLDPNKIRDTGKPGGIEYRMIEGIEFPLHTESVSFSKVDTFMKSNTGFSCTVHKEEGIYEIRIPEMSKPDWDRLYSKNSGTGSLSEVGLNNYGGFVKPNAENTRASGIIVGHVKP